MDSFKGPCPHQSMPVEVDERMTAPDLDLVWFPPCELCNRGTETSRRPDAHGCRPPQGAVPSVGLCGFPESEYRHQPQARPPAAAHSAHTQPSPPADVWRCGSNKQALMYEQDPSNWPWGRSLEEAESLDPPRTLKSDFIYTHYVQYPAVCAQGPSPMQGSCLRPCACCPPGKLPRHSNNYYHEPGYPAGPHHKPQAHWQLNPTQNRQPLEGAPNVNRQSVPQCAAPRQEVMSEVSVGPSFPAGARGDTRGVRKTISLPEECRKVFITYSVDTAEEILPFVKFLVGQGFKPSIDMFDSAIRNMGITQWMDRFLNDKSVLIIVVISPKYKEDVLGEGDDEHGLHTKYIHNQIQNEYIQQGCLNFRLVPVLFPNASKRHVPSWLQSTRIYRWPQDTQDLLLRLLREERYIVPQPSADLTLTVRPL